MKMKSNEKERITDNESKEKISVTVGEGETGFTTIPPSKKNFSLNFEF